MMVDGPGAPGTCIMTRRLPGPWGRRLSAHCRKPSWEVRMPQLFQRSFPPVPASVPAARKAVVASLCTNRFGHIADEAAVATSERVTNAVLHAHGRSDRSVDRDVT